MEKDQRIPLLKVMENRINKIKALRPIDDLCGSVFFQDIGCTQLLLQEIMERPDMRLQKMAPQSVFPNLFGRSGRLDVIAFDEVSGVYNLEFQNDSKGAILDRAFFNYALLARQLIKELSLKISLTPALFLCRRMTFSIPIKPKRRSDLF